MPNGGLLGPQDAASSVDVADVEPARDARDAAHEHAGSLEARAKGALAVARDEEPLAALPHVGEALMGPDQDTPTFGMPGTSRNEAWSAPRRPEVKPFEAPSPTRPTRAAMAERLTEKLSGLFRPDDPR